MWDLVPWAGSCGVLATGPPGKSLLIWFHLYNKPGRWESLLPSISDEETAWGGDGVCSCVTWPGNDRVDLEPKTIRWQSRFPSPFYQATVSITSDSFSGVWAVILGSREALLPGSMLICIKHQVCKHIITCPSPHSWMPWYPKLAVLNVDKKGTEVCSLCFLRNCGSEAKAHLGPSSLASLINFLHGVGSAGFRVLSCKSDLCGSFHLSLGLHELPAR